MVTCFCGCGGGVKFRRRADNRVGIELANAITHWRSYGARRQTTDAFDEWLRDGIAGRRVLADHVHGTRKASEAFMDWLNKWLYHGMFQDVDLHAEKLAEERREIFTDLVDLPGSGPRPRYPPAEDLFQFETDGYFDSVHRPRELFDSDEAYERAHTELLARMAQREREGD